MAELSDDDFKALICLNRRGGGRRIFARLEEGIPPSEILQSIPKSETLFLKGTDKFNPEEEIERCEKKGIRILTWFDGDYPALLKEIPDPPLVLYMVGNMLENDEAALAIVGSRHPSFYGMTQARRFGKELSRQGLTILSGFARGIDRQAHEGALEISYGRTIAVLGSGMDVIYPKEHGKLFEKIKERGAILTEYPLGTDPKAYHFPRRNRIISGLSLGVLVVEAHLRSGSLITAYESAETGREVFSIPGPVDQLTSRGTHRLIKEGAALVENPSEILENLAERLWPIIGITSVIASPPKADEAISKIETDAISKARLLRPYGARNDDTENILLEMLAQKPLSYEEILSGKILSPPELARQMIELEAKKKIRRNLDGRFTLI